MVPRIRPQSFPLLVLALSGCPRRSQPAVPSIPSLPVPHAADAAVVAARDAVVADGAADRDRAITEALASANVGAVPVVDATRDLDGDGRIDALFHTESPAAFGIARATGSTWTAEVIPGQTAPYETAAWSESVPVTGGFALLLARSNRIAPHGAVGNQYLAVVVLTPGGPARTVFGEVFPTEAQWSLRGITPERLELRGVMRSERAGADGGQVVTEVRKVLRPGAPGEWTSAGCWGSEGREPPSTTPRCVVRAPDGTRERRWEQYPVGPPLSEGAPLTLLYAGSAPGLAQRGAQNWCVASEGKTFWVYLPAPALAACGPDRQ
jgi:hypothetical protein